MSKTGAQAIAQSIKDVKTLVEKSTSDLKSEIITNRDTLTNLMTAVVALESRVAEIDVASKSAGTKRQPRVGTKTTNTAPTGKKFPGTSFVWFGQEFKKNPDEIIKRYFKDSHTEQVDKTLEADTKYKSDQKKLEEMSNDNTNKKNQIKKTLIVHKCRAYWNLVKNGEDGDSIKNKIDQDYAAAKKENQQENQTPAKKDEESTA